MLSVIFWMLPMSSWTSMVAVPSESTGRGAEEPDHVDDHRPSITVDENIGLSMGWVKQEDVTNTCPWSDLRILQPWKEESVIGYVMLGCGLGPAPNESL